jgi:hypothetical protein
MANPTGALAKRSAPAVDSLLVKLTPEQEAETDAIRARGTGGPRVITEGTIAYLITFDDGFRVMYRDSAGVVTDYEKAAMARIGACRSCDHGVARRFPADLHRAAGEGISARLSAGRDHAGASRCGTYGGHDGLWRSTEPVFQALKDENRTLSRCRAAIASRPASTPSSTSRAGDKCKAFPI